jgi:hypothetical protein
MTTRTRARFAALALVPMLAGCVSHTWAPPPGGTTVTFGQQSAQCRLFARGNAPASGFIAAAGKPAFVGATVGAFVLASAIGSAVHQQADFNDCMAAAGWIAVDAQR